MVVEINDKIHVSTQDQYVFVLKSLDAVTLYSRLIEAWKDQILLTKHSFPVRFKYGAIDVEGSIQLVELVTNPGWEIVIDSSAMIYPNKVETVYTLGVDPAG